MPGPSKFWIGKKGGGFILLVALWPRFAYTTLTETFAKWQIAGLLLQPVFVTV